mmetsp:Transcript_16896/g.40403  ORF Transcript_16896/g.40403 Transcript_16896/m.40403 type:complete len:236 (+) Transcript_16896:139-846(+)
MPQRHLNLPPGHLNRPTFESKHIPEDRVCGRSIVVKNYSEIVYGAGRRRPNAVLQRAAAGRVQREFYIGVTHGIGGQSADSIAIGRYPPRGSATATGGLFQLIHIQIGVGVERRVSKIVHPQAHVIQVHLGFGQRPQAKRIVNVHPRHPPFTCTNSNTELDPIHVAFQPARGDVWQELDIPIHHDKERIVRQHQRVRFNPERQHPSLEISVGHQRQIRIHGHASRVKVGVARDAA